MLLWKWKGEMKRRAKVFIRRPPDPAVVILDNRSTDGQPHPHPLLAHTYTSVGVHPHMPTAVLFGGV